VTHTLEGLHLDSRIDPQRLADLCGGQTAILFAQQEQRAHFVRR
jgi:hypothetical protein